jgi:hypothetical protein
MVAAIDRTAINAGVARVEQRADDPAAGRGPLDPMFRARASAGTDCGNPPIFRLSDSVHAVRDRDTMMAESFCGRSGRVDGAGTQRVN